MIDTDVFEDDLFKDSVVKADKIDLDEDLFVPSTYEEPSKKTSTGGSIMSDVAKSLNELIRRNKEYRSIISQYQDKVSSLNSQKSALTEKYHEQVQMNQSLTSKVSSLQTSVGKLQNKNESLEGKVSSLQSSMGKLQSINEILDSKVHNQEKLLYSQERELSSLRSQLEGKDDIVKLLADAKAVLGDDSNDYDSVDSYYRKVV